jgi:uncharacterized protein involved in outer membrane biogenesis
LLLGALLIAVRAALPALVKRYVNRELDALEGYSGRIGDIDLSLWRGAYVIEDLRIVKTGGKVPVPFLAARAIDISVEWKALLDGDIVAEIELHRPQLNFVNGPTKATSQTEPASNWQETVRDLAPFRINRFAIIDGEVHYRDFHARPRVDIYVQRIRGVARNLTNAADLSGSLVATFAGKAVAMSSGEISLAGKLNPYAKKPTFEVDAKLDHLNLQQFNDYLRSYANVDVGAGKLSIDAEFAASRGRFRGYVKPFIDDLDVLQWDRERDALPAKLWEGFVELAGEILEDQSKDRIATTVPFSGSIEEPDADVWSTLGGLLKNAFIESLRRGLEDKIGITKLGGDSDKEQG